MYFWWGITIVLLFVGLLNYRSQLLRLRKKAKKDQQDLQSEFNLLVSRAQQELVERELLLDAFEDALMICGADGVVRVANTAAKQLCANRDPRGKSLNEALLNETISKKVMEQIRSGEKRDEQCLLYSSSFGGYAGDAETSWLITTSVLPLREGYQHYATVIRDKTDEHRSGIVKRDFVANVSHELRTPLVIVNGYLENLLEDDLIEDSPEMSRRMLMTMRKHSVRLARLIDEMLTISKLETGNKELLDEEWFSLREVVDEVSQRLAPLVETQGADLAVKIDEQLKIRGDRFYWDQTLFNLMENALKQNPLPGTKVKVKAKQGGGMLVIDVVDNGVGIPASDLPFIFNRFYRVQKHHSQNEIKGTGLGLSIVKHAMEMQEATIDVISRPGIKTVFRIKTPHFEMVDQ